MSRKHWMWAAAALVLVFAAALWSMRDDYVYARIATGHAAKEVCSCVHVSGRALESCMGDIPPEQSAQVHVTEGAANVRASAWLGVVRAQATYEEEFGCTLAE